MQMAAQERAERDAAAEARGSARAMAGFMAMAFAVVGLTGLLAAHVSRLPLERAMAREGVLDQALAAARSGDRAGLEALRVKLGDSAPALLTGADGEPAGFEARVAAERVAMRARRMAEADATGGRLRALLVVVTIIAAGFGAALLLAGRRVAAGGKLG